MFLEEEEDRLDYDGVGKAMVSFIEQQVLTLVPSEYVCVHVVDDKSRGHLWTQRAGSRSGRLKSKGPVSQETNVNSDASVARCVGGGIPVSHDFADRPAGANFRADEKQLSGLLGHSFDRVGGPRLVSCLCVPVRVSRRRTRRWRRWCSS